VGEGGSYAQYRGAMDTAMTNHDFYEYIRNMNWMLYFELCNSENVTAGERGRSCSSISRDDLDLCCMEAFPVAHRLHCARTVIDS
jgi:hypothetical protein